MSSVSDSSINVQSSFSIHGKVTLVTGGSRGIGLMIARGLSEPPIETLDETVFDRSAWPNEPQLDAVLVGPLIKRLAGELRSVVDDDPLRERTTQRNPAGNPADSYPGYRGVDLDRQTLTSGVVDNISAS